MKELWTKIREALVSTLPITLLVYLVALLPAFSFTRYELISFTIGAILLILRIVFKRRLSLILMLFYMLLFALAAAL